MKDLMILLGILLVMGGGIWGAVKNQGIYFKIGSILMAGAACVGLAYFGWLPFLGGSHDTSVYFGCVMLTFGIAGWLFFCGASAARLPAP